MTFRHIIILVFSLFFSSLLSSQTEGRIHYTETLSKEDAYKDWGEDFKKMMPETQKFQKELIFNQASSIYHEKKDIAKETTEVTNDEGNVRWTMNNERDESKLYTDLKSKKSILQKDEEGKKWLIEQDLKQMKWKLTGEKVMYLNYECHKAVVETADDFIIAWFTPQIPVSAGPRHYNGLPGLILMLTINEGTTEIRAKDINFTSLEEKEIKKPKKGKKVTEEEFEQLIKDFKEERKKIRKRNKFNKRRR